MSNLKEVRERVASGEYDHHNYENFAMLETTLGWLDEALKFARHKPNCDVRTVLWSGLPADLPCDCGLDAFLASLNGESK